MKNFSPLCVLSALSFLLGCSSPKEEDPDLEEMVLNEEEEVEWTSSQLDGKNVADEAVPAPQEVFIFETPDSAIDLNSSFR